MKEKIYKIGLTGPSGAGKSLFAHYFSCMGIPVLDADEIYHSLVNSDTECLRELGCEFGSELTEGGRLNRRALRAIVFAEDGKEKLARLNEITHKHVIKRTDELICELSEKVSIAESNAFHPSCSFSKANKHAASTSCLRA